MAEPSIRSLREFCEISEEFRSGNYGLQNVAQLIACIRIHKKVLTSEQSQALLQVPIDVLENDVGFKEQSSADEECDNVDAGDDSEVGAKESAEVDDIEDEDEDEDGTPPDIPNFDTEMPANNLVGMGKYFSENIVKSDHGYLDELQSKFQAGTHQLDDILALTRYVQERFDELGSQVEFLLRVPEVTIRDYVELRDDSRFMFNGKAFACHIERVIGL